MEHLLSQLNLNTIIGVAIGVVGWLIRRAIKTPKDHETATLITRLADDAAAVVIVLAPNAAWAAMLRDVIARLKSQLPEVDPQALESAATGALVRLGKSPTTQ